MRVMRFSPINVMEKTSFSLITRVGDYLSYLWQYRSIFIISVRNDIKGRFKNTFLGYFWHLLNPLSQIVIYFLIFTVIFGKGIPNYWVYISTGMFAFGFFMSIVPNGSNCIVANSRMVTKMAMAREILVFSKATVNLIYLSISYTILSILMIITGVGLSWNVLFVPLIVISFFVFCIGLALALSAIVVYIRDVSNVVSILMGCMLFAVPIIYMASQRSTPAMEIFWSINPLYYYIETIHDAFYWGVCPDLFQLGVCLILAPISFLIGLAIFKKLEKGFAERL